MANQKGATAVLIAISLFAIVGFVALTIDLGHHYVVKNELKNAADAGSLAGARFLYNDTGTAVNHAGYTNKDGVGILSANQIAHDSATENKGQKEAVEVINWSTNNCSDDEDVQRGHWRLSDRTFHCSTNTDPTTLFGVSEEVLDNDLDFINAVKVRTRRETTPIISFFARIFGYQSFTMTVESVAWIGFENYAGPADLPIAVCSYAVQNSNGDYDCNIGRMFRTPSETAMWTSLEQCKSDGGPSVNTPTVRGLIKCEVGDGTLVVSPTIGTNNGQIETVFEDIEACWRQNTMDDDNFVFGVKPWTVKLPVIRCVDMNNQTCAPVLSITEFNILWVNASPSDDQYPVKTEGIEIKDADDNIVTTYEAWPVSEDKSDGGWNEVTDPDDNTVILEADTDAGETLTQLSDYKEGEYYDTTDGDTATTTVYDLWYPESNWSNKKLKRSNALRSNFWSDFADNFNLKMINPDYDPNYPDDPNNPEYITAEYDQMTIYFLPDCSPKSPAGGSGIHNFATLAARPVLVK